jgi:hypothetical protein
LFAVKGQILSSAGAINVNKIIIEQKRSMSVVCRPLSVVKKAVIKCECYIFLRMFVFLINNGPLATDDGQIKF